MNQTAQYEALNKKIGEQARQMKDALLVPVLDDKGGFIGESATRNERIDSAVGGTIFEAAGKQAGAIAATASNALRAYCESRGRMPADDLLASAHQAIQNVLESTQPGTGNKLGGIFEAASLETTDGIIMRDRMIALVLPVMLQQISSNMVSFIPGQFNQSEIFRIHRQTASDWAGVAKGTRLRQNYTIQYGSMDLRQGPTSATKVGNGAIVLFTWDPSATLVNGGFAGVYPIRKKSIKILLDRNIVAADDGNGNFVSTSGVLAASGNSISYATGAVSVTFAAAPAAGIEVQFAFDIDIEASPSLIPAINHEMEAKVLYPHQAAIAGNTSLQTLWNMRREMNLNTDSMAMLAMRNVLAADKDRKHLRDLRYYASGSVTFNGKYPAGPNLSVAEWNASILPTLLQIDSNFQANTQYSGLVGIIADTKSSVFFKSLGINYEPPPNYRNIPQPHYAGRIFGLFDLYVDPYAPDYKCVCFAKGTDLCQSAYIAGDAVPAMAFKHAILQSDLRYHNTLWELAYRDLQPFDGRQYVTNLVLDMVTAT